MKKNSDNELITDMKQVPAIIRFWAFWFGRETTDWAGIQRVFNLSDEIIRSLKADNKAYRSPSL